MERISQDRKFIQILSKEKNWSLHDFTHLFWNHCFFIFASLYSPANLLTISPTSGMLLCPLAFDSLSHTKVHLFALILYPFLIFGFKIYILQKSFSDSFELFLTAEYPGHFLPLTFYILISLCVSPHFHTSL